MVKLYHATPKPFEAPILEPRSYREINGKTGPFAFATDNKQHALTYTITKGVRLMNAPVEETGTQILILDSESIIGDPDLKGGIYSFESESFENAILKGMPSNQWVSKKNTNLEAAEYKPIRSLNDLMQEGIQLYQIGENPDFTADTFYNQIIETDDGLFKSIQEQLTLKNMRWMNKERNINPQNPFPKSENQHPETITDRSVMKNDLSI